MAWQDWTPDVFGTTKKPNLGSNPVRVGRYNVTADGTVEGWGLVRAGTNPNRGRGVFRVTLPVAGVDTDPRGFTIVGCATIGWAVSGLPRHRSCTLHLCGFPGYADDQKAVLVPDMRGFAPADHPMENIHWRFTYEAAS